MIKIEIYEDTKAHEIRRIIAALRTYVDYPPEGLEISSGPVDPKPIKVHCPSGKEAEATASVNLNDTFDPEDVEVVVTDEAPVVDATPPVEVVEETPDGAPVKETDIEELKKELNLEARKLMKEIVASGTPVKELKAKLSEKIGGDVTKLDVAGLRKAIKVMEGMR